VCSAGASLPQSETPLTVGWLCESQMAERYWPGQADWQTAAPGLPEGDLHAVDDGSGEVMTSSWGRAMPIRSQVYQPVTQTVAMEGVLASVGD